MTRPDLQCIHEPFGDAFYYGPERLSSRFEIDSNARVDSGFSESTYQTIFDRIAEEGAEVRSLPPFAVRPQIISALQSSASRCVDPPFWMTKEFGALEFISICSHFRSLITPLAL